MFLAVRSELIRLINQVRFHGERLYSARPHELWPRSCLVLPPSRHPLQQVSAMTATFAGPRSACLSRNDDLSNCRRVLSWACMSGIGPTDCVCSGTSVAVGPLRRSHRVEASLPVTTQGRCLTRRNRGLHGRHLRNTSHPSRELRAFVREVAKTTLLRRINSDSEDKMCHARRSL